MEKNNKKVTIFVFYIFFGLFVLILGYFTYYLTFKSKDVVNSTYNLRHDVLAKRVIRGDIMSADGIVLAETIADEDGNEERFYPFDDMYAHVVGRVMRGRTGIEEVENITLLTSDSRSSEVLYNDLIGSKNPGNNVVSTLNHKLTKVAYDALGDNRGAVVAIEPSTGKILAMVSKPAYNPNKIEDMWEELSEDVEDESPLLNRASQGLYPPGSTFKVITALAYMRENPEFIDYSYKCTGSTEYEGMTIRCSNNSVHGRINLKEAFAKSCNSSFANIGSSIPVDSFRSLSESFFFNRVLPAKVINNPSSFEMKIGDSSVKEAMQTAIGQGRTLISPLHNVMIASTVANGGIMMKPYVIDRIESSGGRLLKGYIPEEAAKPITLSEANYLKSLMAAVVTDGTAKKLNNLDVKVAGKTGTAQQEGYESHAWFIGFAPVNKPKIAISVVIENKGSGSEHAVPIAEKVFDAYFD